jgi:hypothetical protein
MFHPWADTAIVGVIRGGVNSRCDSSMVECENRQA